MLWSDVTHTDMTSPFLPGCRASRPSPNTPKGTRTYRVELEWDEMNWDKVRWDEVGWVAEDAIIDFLYDNWFSRLSLSLSWRSYSQVINSSITVRWHAAYIHIAQYDTVQHVPWILPFPQGVLPLQEPDEQMPSSQQNVIRCNRSWCGTIWFDSK